MVHRTIGWLLYGLLCAAPGCSGPEEVPISPTGPEAVAHLAGVVLSPTGEAVSGSTVTAIGGPCNGGFQITPSLGVSDVLGRYGGTVKLPRMSTFHACLSLTAEAPQGSGLAAATVTGIELDFFDVSEGRVDSVAVNISLVPANP